MIYPVSSTLVTLQTREINCKNVDPHVKSIHELDDMGVLTLEYLTLIKLRLTKEASLNLVNLKLKKDTLRGNTYLTNNDDFTHSAI